MMKPQLIAITGIVAAGKTSLGERLSEKLQCRFQDIDNLRIDVFGWENHPRPDPTLIDLSPLVAQDKTEREASYKMLLGMAEAFLKNGRSIIVASFSMGRPWNQNHLQAIAAKTGADLKLIRCMPHSADRREIERRLAAGTFGENYNVRLPVTFAQYDFIWQQLLNEEVAYPHLLLDTGEPFDECVKKALDYIRSE
jgi:predicted kinase